MKFVKLITLSITLLVAPLVGAWIEISLVSPGSTSVIVAPLVGAWIEISCTASESPSMSMSLLSWERGLKSADIVKSVQKIRRSSRGSVD